MKHMLISLFAASIVLTGCSSSQPEIKITVAGMIEMRPNSYAPPKPFCGIHWEVINGSKERLRSLQVRFEGIDSGSIEVNNLGAGGRENGSVAVDTETCENLEAKLIDVKCDLGEADCSQTLAKAFGDL